MAKPAARSPEWRKACGRVHKRAKELGLDDDARRDLQRRATGKESCAQMTAAELRRVLVEMTGGGGKRPARVGGRDRLPDAREPTRKMSGKLQALWISGYHLGVVRDRTDEALAAWLRRQTGLDAAAWAKPAALARAVEALQSWLAREAGVDWSPYAELGRDGKLRQVARPQARVLEAQWRILHRLGAVRIGDLSALASYAAEYASLGRVDSHLALDAGQTIQLMQHLGRRIRKARATVAPEPAA